MSKVRLNFIFNKLYELNLGYPKYHLIYTDNIDFHTYIINTHEEFLKFIERYSDDVKNQFIYRAWKYSPAKKGFEVEIDYPWFKDVKAGLYIRKVNEFKLRGNENVK